MNSDENQLRRFPATFRNEVAAIRAGAMNGGIISPRRHGGVLIEMERVKGRYDAKIATLRARDPSLPLDEVETEIAKTASEFAATLSTDNAA